MGDKGNSARGSALAGVAGTIALGLGILSFGGCGGGERQDVDEPQGDFPVEVTTAKFPARQRLADTKDLQLGVKNVGQELIPDLAVTIFVDEGADGPFSIRLEQPGLANPNRPVWILENNYPKLKGETATAGAETAFTNTYAFGPLEPGDTREMVWRVTAVRGGTYTVNYEIAAGLQGKAKAVTEEGSQPTGKFVVTISTKPPKATVSGSGKVVIGDGRRTP